MWGYVIGAVIAYFLFKEKIAKIKGWIKRHKDLIDKWKDEPEIMAAYENLKQAVEMANLDRKWSIIEIVTVLGLAITLFKLVKKFEEAGKNT